MDSVLSRECANAAPAGMESRVSWRRAPTSAAVMECASMRCARALPAMEAQIAVCELAATPSAKSTEPVWEISADVIRASLVKSVRRNGVLSIAAVEERALLVDVCATPDLPAGVAKCYRMRPCACSIARPSAMLSVVLM